MLGHVEKTGWLHTINQYLTIKRVLLKRGINIMKIEFIQGRVSIQSNAAEWGPFNFDFSDALPADKVLTLCTVTSYLGRVKPDDSDDLASETDTTSELIGTTAVASDTVVTVQFNRPTTEAYINVSHTLVFNFTISGGGTHSAYYYRVQVL